jgi:hypothetical protein
VVDESVPFEPEDFADEFFKEFEAYEQLVTKKPY